MESFEEKMIDLTLDAIISELSDQNNLEYIDNNLKILVRHLTGKECSFINKYQKKIHNIFISFSDHLNKLKKPTLETFSEFVTIVERCIYKSDESSTFFSETNSSVVIARPNRRQTLYELGEKTNSSVVIAKPNRRQTLYELGEESVEESSEPSQSYYDKTTNNILSSSLLGLSVVNGDEKSAFLNTSSFFSQEQLNKSFISENSNLSSFQKEIITYIRDFCSLIKSFKFSNQSSLLQLLSIFNEITKMIDSIDGNFCSEIGSLQTELKDFVDCLSENEKIIQLTFVDTNRIVYKILDSCFTTKRGNKRLLNKQFIMSCVNLFMYICQIQKTQLLNESSSTTETITYFDNLDLLEKYFNDYFDYEELAILTKVKYFKSFLKKFKSNINKAEEENKKLLEAKSIRLFERILSTTADRLMSVISETNFKLYQKSRFLKSDYNVGTYLVSCHGDISMDKYTVIPPNTYVVYYVPEGIYERPTKNFFDTPFYKTSVIMSDVYEYVSTSGNSNLKILNSKKNFDSNNTLTGRKEWTPIIYKPGDLVPMAYYDFYTYYIYTRASAVMDFAKASMEDYDSVRTKSADYDLDISYANEIYYHKIIAKKNYGHILSLNESKNRTNNITKPPNFTDLILLIKSSQKSNTRPNRRDIIFNEMCRGISNVEKKFTDAKNLFFLFDYSHSFFSNSALRKLNSFNLETYERELKILDFNPMEYIQYFPFVFPRIDNYYIDINSEPYDLKPITRYVKNGYPDEYVKFDIKVPEKLERGLHANSFVSVASNKNSTLTPNNINEFFENILKKHKTIIEWKLEKLTEFYAPGFNPFKYENQNYFDILLSIKRKTTENGTLDANDRNVLNFIIYNQLQF
jgi:hypothetical protein